VSKELEYVLPTPSVLGALRFLCYGDVEDVLQPLVHVAHAVGGGFGEHVQKHGRRGHVLTGPNEDGELPLHPLHRRGPAFPKRSFTLVQVGQPGLNSHLFIGELSSLLCGFSFNVGL
jgi:hypothetical protein